MRAIKTVLFHILRTFRWLFLLACKLLGSLCMIGFLISLFAGGEMSSGQKAAMLGFAVGFGALAWYYDVLLLKLKPDDVDMALSQ